MDLEFEKNRDHNALLLSDLKQLMACLVIKLDVKCFLSK